MKAGQAIANLQTGETLKMIVSEEDTQGTRQLYEVKVPPRRPSPPLHFHTRFTETFSVLDGELDLFLGRDRKHVVLRAGEKRRVEIGQSHTFANNRDGETRITIETIPAGTVVEAFQLAYGVANDGAAGSDGLPRSLLIRLIFVRLTEGYFPGIPLVLQKAALATAGFVARVTGVEGRLQKYFADRSLKSAWRSMR